MSPYDKPPQVFFFLSSGIKFKNIKGRQYKRLIEV